MILFMNVMLHQLNISLSLLHANIAFDDIMINKYEFDINNLPYQVLHLKYQLKALKSTEAFANPENKIDCRPTTPTYQLQHSDAMNNKCLSV